MADTFQITAEINARLGGSVGNTIRQLRKQLSEVNTNVNIGVGNASKNLTGIDRSAKKAAVSIKKVGTEIKKTNSELVEFGRVSGLALRRFAGFSIAAGGVFGFIRAVTGGISQAIKFERELARVSQVTGKTVAQLKPLTDEISRLSITFGTSSASLVEVSKTLSQAGLSAREVKTSLEALAKSTLLPTFTDINKTVEGSIAIFRQFKIEAKDLEGVFGSINAVAGKFAVESDDIIQAVRRTGGVFAAASKDVSTGREALNEFIATFTSIRATTRESAESIATGLRTIITRLQRLSTIKFLRNFGVELQNAQGQFVGAFEAINRLGEGLKKVDRRSGAFADILEELGGFRQVGKTIPLILQTETRLKALQVATDNQHISDTELSKAQQTLAVRLQSTVENFQKLIRELTQTSTFKAMADLALNLANAFIEVSRSIKPLIPLITTFAAVKIGAAIPSLIRGFGSGVRSAGGAAGPGLNKGGKVRGFNTGGVNGLIPGRGPNRDDTLIAVTGGEYVIQRKAADEIGVKNLDILNNSKGFNSGGPVGFVKGGGVPLKGGGALGDDALRSLGGPGVQKVIKPVVDLGIAAKQSAKELKKLAQAGEKRESARRERESKRDPSETGPSGVRPSDTRALNESETKTKESLEGVKRRRAIDDAAREAERGRRRRAGIDSSATKAASPDLDRAVALKRADGQRQQLQKEKDQRDSDRKERRLIDREAKRIERQRKERDRRTVREQIRTNNVNINARPSRKPKLGIGTPDGISTIQPATRTVTGQIPPRPPGRLSRFRSGFAAGGGTRKFGDRLTLGLAGASVLARNASGEGTETNVGLRATSGALSGAAAGGAVAGPFGAAIGATAGFLLELENSTNELALAQSKAANSKFFKRLENLDFDDKGFEENIQGFVSSLKKAREEAKKTTTGTGPGEGGGFNLLSSGFGLLGLASIDSSNRGVSIGTSLSQGVSSAAGGLGNLIQGNKGIKPGESTDPFGRAALAVFSKAEIEKEGITSEETTRAEQQLTRAGSRAKQIAPAGGALEAFNEATKRGTKLFDLKNQLDATAIKVIRTNLAAFDKESIAHNDLQEALKKGTISLKIFTNSLDAIGVSIAANQEAFNQRQQGISDALTVAGGGRAAAGGRQKVVDFSKGGAAASARLQSSVSQGILSGDQAKILNDTIQSGARLGDTFDKLELGKIFSEGDNASVLRELEKTVQDTVGLDSPFGKAFREASKSLSGLNRKEFREQLEGGGLRKKLIGGPQESAIKQAQASSKAGDVQQKASAASLRKFNDLLKKQNEDLDTITKDRRDKEEQLARLAGDFLPSSGLRGTSGTGFEASEIGSAKGRAAAIQQRLSSGDLADRSDPFGDGGTRTEDQVRKSLISQLQNLNNEIVGLEQTVKNDKETLQRNIEITGDLIATEKEVVESSRKVSEGFARSTIADFGKGARAAGGLIRGGRQTAEQRGQGIDFLRQLQTQLAPIFNDQERQNVDKGLNQIIGNAILNSPNVRAQVAALESIDGVTKEQVKAFKDSIVKGKTDKQTQLLEQQKRNFDLQLAIAREELTVQNAILATLRDEENDVNNKNIKRLEDQFIKKVPKELAPQAPQEQIGRKEALRRNRIEFRKQQGAFRAGHIDNPRDAFLASNRRLRDGGDNVNVPRPGEGRGDGFFNVRDDVGSTSRMQKAADTFQTAAASIPAQIGFGGNLDVNVNINGAQGLLDSALRPLIETTVANTVRKMVDPDFLKEEIA